MRDFSVKINTAMLEDEQTNTREQYADEDVNKAITVSNGILGVLDKNDIGMQEAYMILLALAESIYISSICGGTIIE